MTELALPAAGSTPASHPWRRARRALLVLALLGVLALVGGQVAIVSIHPAAQGSFSAVNVVGGAMCGDPMMDSASCVVSDYAPGKSAALAFSIRNDGPIGMTVEAVQPIGADLVPLVALYPALPASGQLVSWTDTRPFEPIEVSPGGEAIILMIGSMSTDCETVGVNWMVDGGLIIDHALLTVRWGLIGSEITLPFVSAMEVRIPQAGACSGT
jgi:hypothetical protein